jgi:LytS/YehU family sensor histidine kinase
VGGQAALPSTLVFLTNKSAAGVITYLGIVAGTLAIDHARRADERERTTEALRSDLAESRLEALRLQLQPHFLFNALLAVSGAIDSGDASGARLLLSRIGALLRRTLEAGSGETSLEEELILLDHHLDVERARFGDALDVALRVDASCLRALVPTLILQPLVENAIRHATRDRSTVRVEVGARPEGDRLWLWVTDDGPGFGAAQRREGVGLSNTRSRLEQAYGDRGRLEIGEGPGGRVALWLPFQAASS